MSNINDNKCKVKLENVSLSFPLYSNKDPNIKSNIVNLFTKGDSKNSEKQYLHALNNLNLEINENEVVGIVGHNGAGKSTLMRVISNIYSPDSGEININGHVVPLLGMGIGFNANLDAEENIKIASLLMRLSNSDIKDRIERILKFAELEKFRKLPIKYYSKGMHMRLGFTTATDVVPEILLLDEVFSGGDMHWMQKAIKRMEDVIAYSKIVIIISHSMDLIKQQCNRVIWMEKGEIKLDGDPELVISEYRNNKPK